MKIIFITGTRADFGKLKPLINKFYNSQNVKIIATGMHLIKELGNTVAEVEKYFSNNVIRIKGQDFNESMVEGFSRFMIGFRNYLIKLKTPPDLIIVHGDRFDALAASIVANELNFRVCHIEGGEISGTIDEAIRHSVSKFSHIHFVSNDIAKNRILKLGENPNFVFISGSPETDILLGNDLPKLIESKKRYNIKFKNYIIFCMHPVVSELNLLKKQIKEIFKFLKELNLGIILIHPNNDEGSSIILSEIERSKIDNLKSFQSIRFEHYITFLKNSKAIIGNSSSVVREAPTLGIPSINIGSRQQGRTNISSVIDSLPDYENLVKSWKDLNSLEDIKPNYNFGEGNVASYIYKKILELDLEKINTQKKYY